MTGMGRNHLEVFRQMNGSLPFFAALSLVATLLNADGEPPLLNLNYWQFE